ncbi:hypothetical protein Tco_1574575, partial [Tanacetum coccineum]
DNNEQTDSDNDGNDFVYPKLSTHDEENVQEIQGMDVEEEEMYEENTNGEKEVNELDRDVNVNLEGRDTVGKNDRCSTHYHSNYSGIDSIFNLNTELTSLVDVPVTTISETPLLSATILPPPPIPLIPRPQQTPISTPTLETDFLEFKQTNQFATTVSSIPGIVDAYLANKMHEAVKTVVQLQSDRLRDEAQAKNANFINKLDDNIKKIIKDQVKEQVKAQVSKILPKFEKTVNEQLEVEVLTHSSSESNTSHAVAANLSELELKKILIDKMESNKSIHRSDE